MNTLPVRPTLPIARGRHRQLHELVGVVVSVVLVAVFAVSCGRGSVGSSSNEPTFTFVIPDGSAERVEQGEKLDILPATLEADLNDTIVIRNEDHHPHFLGPWFLGPRETLRQRFTTVGVFEGTCSVHPSGEFAVVVGA